MIPKESPIRQSVDFGVATVENRCGWSITQTYDTDAEFGIGIVDLSHRPKALLHGPSAEQLNLHPGRAQWNGHAWTGRLNHSTAQVFDILGDLESDCHPTAVDYFTDLTDGWALIGLIGPQAESVMRRLVDIDFERPTVKGPIFIATRAHGVNMRIVNPKGKLAGYLLACERSYGQSLYDYCLDVGRPREGWPIGVTTFEEWTAQLSPCSEPVTG